MITFAETMERRHTRIKVIGIGGGGGNTLNSMIENELEGVEFYALNTDMQALDSNLATSKIQIGERLTRGLGAGARPEIGKNAATEDISRIEEAVSDCEMVFLTAGMGGGTGTGATPVIAKAAREAGALTVAVVTTPFPFEGSIRNRNADYGLQELRDSVDSLIVVPNQKLLEIIDPKTPLADSFKIVNMVLYNAVRSISDIIVIPGLVNVDFADVETIMSNRGKAIMGTGEASGEDRARRAAEAAIHSPLLDDSTIHGATGILINITGGSDLTLFEINEAASLITGAADDSANIIFGAVQNDAMKDKLRVTVVATGFDTRKATADAADLLKPQEVPTPRWATDDSTFDSTPIITEEIPIPSRAPLTMGGSQTSIQFSGGQPQTYGGASTATSVAPRRQQQQQQAKHPDYSNPFAKAEQSEYDLPTFMRNRTLD